MLRYTSCRKNKTAKAKRTEENQGSSQDIPKTFLRNLNLENQRSNNTQTLKFLEKKFFSEEQKAGVPAEKIQKHRNVQRKQTLTVKRKNKLSAF